METLNRHDEKYSLINLDAICKDLTDAMDKLATLLNCTPTYGYDGGPVIYDILRKRYNRRCDQIYGALNSIPKASSNEINFNISGEHLQQLKNMIKCIEKVIKQIQTEICNKLLKLKTISNKKSYVYSTTPPPTTYSYDQIIAYNAINEARILLQNITNQDKRNAFLQSVDKYRTHPCMDAFRMSDNEFRGIFRYCRHVFPIKSLSIYGSPVISNIKKLYGTINECLSIVFHTLHPKIIDMVENTCNSIEKVCGDKPYHGFGRDYNTLKQFNECNLEFLQLLIKFIECTNHANNVCKIIKDSNMCTIIMTFLNITSFNGVGEVFHELLSDKFQEFINAENTDIPFRNNNVSSKSIEYFGTKYFLPNIKNKEIESHYRNELNNIKYLSEKYQNGTWFEIINRENGIIATVSIYGIYNKYLCWRDENN